MKNLVGTQHLTITLLQMKQYDFISCIERGLIDNGLTVRKTS